MPRKVSLKEIVKAIERPCRSSKKAPRNQGTESADERAMRAKKILKGMRESVEGICVPDFEVPAA